MQNRPSEQLKSIAAELAALVYAGSTDTVKMNALLAQLRQPVATPAATAKAPVRSNAIGIWKPSKEGNTYERDVDQHLDWPLWASVHRIEPKGKKKRILLLGESVARGYFYDPLYTVANELEAILTASGPLQESEVIDLAKTSMTLEQLLELASSCTRLEPDAIVVFAGNNWDSTLAQSMDAATEAKLFELYKEGLGESVKEFLEERYAQIVSDALAKLAAPFRQQNIPMLFVIPPFNLRDWHSDEAERILPWVPDNRLEPWLDARSRAEGALASNDTEGVLAAASAMVQLDPSNPLGFEFLGEAQARSGQQKEAIVSFEQARDAAIIGRGNNTKPRCFGIVARTIEAEAPALGLHVLNLPRIFNESPEGVPGRDLFLDYCHLTVKGIKIAMTHVAQALCKTLGLGDYTYQPSGLQPNSEVLAMAHFCAAIHNAHWGQGNDILEYHCSQAVQHSPSVQTVMLQYMNFSTRHASSILCKSFEEVLVGGAMRQYEGGRALRHPRGKKLLDLALNDAIVRALGQRGVDVRRELSKLRRGEHAITGDYTDLLEFYYSKTSYNDFIVQPRPGFLQARNTTSRFSFVVGDHKNLTFSLVYRTPRRAYEEKKITLFINENALPVTGLPMSREWITYTFTLNDADVKEGVNTLSIHWPYSHEPLTAATLATGGSFMNEIFPVLGEVHSFIVTGAREASPATAVPQPAYSRVSV